MTVKELINALLECEMEDEVIISMHDKCKKDEDPDIYHYKIDKDDIAYDCGEMGQLIIFADMNEAELKDY